MKVAFVCGASGGLGRDTALMLLQRGIHVIATYNNTLKEKVLQPFLNYKGLLSLHKMDILDENQIVDTLQTTEKTHGHIDFLVNCSGANKDGIFAKYPEQSWDTVIGVNLTGAYNLIKHSIALLERSNSGHILLVSSISGLTGKAGQVAYSASKGALIDLTPCLARELSEKNIRLNTLLPGYMDTNMGRENKKAINDAKNKSLLNCLSTTKEGAKFIKFLLNTKNITGQVFTLDSRIR